MAPLLHRLAQPFARDGLGRRGKLRHRDLPFFFPSAAQVRIEKERRKEKQIHRRLLEPFLHLIGEEAGHFRVGRQTRGELRERPIESFERNFKRLQLDGETELTGFFSPRANHGLRP